MQVAIRATGPLRDALGVRRALTLPAGATVADALAALAGEAAMPAGLLDRAAVSIEGAIVDRGHALAEGDEIALVVPAAGG